MAQIRIPGHFLFSDLHQQCATIFASIGRILLAMKQSFPVKLEQHWKKDRSSIILHWWPKIYVEENSGCYDLM